MCVRACVRAGFPNLVELYVDTRESLVDVLSVSGMAWLSALSVSGRLKQLHIVDNPLLATLSLFRCPELRVELVAPRLKSFEVQSCWRLRRLDERFECPTLVNVALFSTSLAGDDVARLCPSASEFQVRTQLRLCALRVAGVRCVLSLFHRSTKVKRSGTTAPEI